jgi:serine/threonine protein kinase/roadblock/LC7 domain-containing protein
MALTSGTRLGPYEIVAPLGAGGMGEVYRARDTRLDRTVAVKILTQGLADTPEVRQRFEREARAVSSLNHPHICALYDVGHQDGIEYLVMEYLEGETLAARIEKGPMPTADLLRYASQIADALDKAHRQGIVHRDLKPGNVMLTKSGAKLLDFGLAKGGEIIQGGDLSSSPTMSRPLTTQGTIVGTLQYMSPEQLEGKATDARSDIFSFGAMLYEMATGKKAFEAKSHASLIAAIMKEEPRPMRELQPMTPLLLEHIVKSCLAKDPDDRPQSAHDLKLELDWIRESSGISDVAKLAVERSPARSKSAAIILAVGVLSLIAAIAIVFLLRPQNSRAERLEFSIPLQGEMSHLALSPDGRMLAFVTPDQASGANMLGLQRVGSPGITILPGTQGASYPFWSPDDSYVAFFADGKLKKVAASGGVPQVLAIATSGRGGSWSRRGVIVFSPQASGWLWKVNADGSNAVSLTDKLFDASQIVSHRWPVFLPDGEHFLYIAVSFTNNLDNSARGIYVGSLSGEAKRLISAAQSNPGYANGYLFYLDEKKSLRASQVDVSKGTVSGESQVVTDQIGYQPSIFWGAFSVAENGTTVYNTNVGSTLSVLTWYDRAGKELGRVGDVGVISNPTLSPDGSRLAEDIADAKANNVNLWLSDIKRGTNSRFTFDSSEAVAGVWSRDGNLVAYRSLALNDTNIFLKQAQGLQPAQSIFSAKTSAHTTDDLDPNSWSLDDKQLLCTLQPAAGGSQLVLLSASGGKLTPFLSTKSNETNGQISPDGKWVAYASNESGDWEIYVTTFPTAAGKWQVSRGGGTEPRWRGDSKEIFYIAPGSTLTAVPVAGGDTFSSGNPTPLFRTQFRANVSSTDLYSYDVTKDGQRFLVNRYAKPPQVAPLHIVLNSTAGLTK